MKVTFLSAKFKLTKTYAFNNGQIDVTPYPLTSEFVSYEEQITNLEDLLVQVVAHGQAGHCMLKGNLTRPLVKESRAGLMASEETWILVLDFDGLDLHDRTIDEVLADLGLGDVSYILQYSASHGIKKGFNAHVFMMLSKPISAEALKVWLKWKNLTTDFLRQQISLTKTNMGLHWPLDVTLAQNDKLIYIAPPIVIGTTDPVPERVVLVEKAKPSALLSSAPLGIEEQAKDILKQLRSIAGLPTHNLNTKYSRKYNAELLRSPDTASVTGVKHNGDFTYINLNGGDSWAYFHLSFHPEVLDNFKGEPQYLLEELCPSYYQEAKALARQSKREAHVPKELNGKPQRWIINCKQDGKYYKVTYTPEQGVDLVHAPSLKHVTDWCNLRGLVIPEFIDDWDVEFDPTSKILVDSENRKINLYRPSLYRVRATKDAHEIPDVYQKLIYHVCGSDDEAYERFINWLAFIWQTGKRPGTAWVLHGIPGSGKGLLSHVLQRLFGDHCVMANPESIEDKFNAHLKSAQLVWLDELSMDSWNVEKMTPKLRGLIAGESSLRAMHVGWQSVNFFFGMIIAGNEFNVVEIKPGDRRFSVAPRQEVPLKLMPWFNLELVDEEFGSLYQSDNLQALANYLYSYEVEEMLARSPLENEARQKVIQVTQSLPEEVVLNLNQGNAAYFVFMAKSALGGPDLEAAEYRDIVAKMMQGGDVALRTEEIRKIFSVICGWNNTPGRFTKAASKYGLMLSGKVVRDGNKTFAGKKFNFHVTDEARELWEQLVEERSNIHAVKSNVISMETN